MSPSVSVRLSFCLLLAASAACTEGEIETAAPVEQTHVAALADGGIALPDAALADAGTPAEELTTTLTTLAEFRGTVDVAAGTMRLEVLEGDAVTDAGLRRAQQGLCTLTIVQDGVAGSGPLNSLELVTGTTGLDASCEGYVASPLFCGAVTVRSFYTSPQTQVFAQIQSLAPSTGFSVQNGDVVPGASSGLGSWAYGDLGAASSAPANAGVRNWVFARSDGNFTFTGRLVANVTELCDGLDNDCDGLTDEGIGCRTQGQSCAATVDCSGTLVCTASVCSPAGCPSGQHLESGACVSDTRSCVATNATAATETWTGSAYGTCTISACSAGFALVANSCVGGCGNGVIGSGETCDDGNTVTEECAYGMTDCSVCNASCQTAMGETDFCTDNTLDPAEFCDDGNTINTDSCNNSCTCGTGYHAEGGICANDVQACTIS
ncbi:MAG: hypothetical protein HQ461_07725, partial [Deltaproteobacteria bacterium]|nr:hypothetical protein [Deltaproteobacteria bacterium]